MRWSSVAVALASAKSFAVALDPVSVVGNKFFNKDGSQFFIKGIAYQLVPQDPLVDADQCKRDAKLMAELGTNTIRVYHVDPSADHDGCMSAFDDAGIYVLADLDTFDTYIIPQNNYWNKTKFDRYAEVLDAFQKYDNLLGVFVGNENIATKDDSPTAPYLKAAARDMKAYRDAQGYRDIPVGYSAADILQLRPMLQDYLTCGGNSSETVDFFSLNSYSWCDPSTYKESTYDQLEEYAKNFPVPIFLSETGCIVPGPRLFDDQDAIFGPEMVNDWSGAIIYEWIQEENGYGIITYAPAGQAAGPNVEGGFLRKGTPTPKLPDFTALQSKWATNTPTGVKRDDYNADDVSTRACPTSTAGGWWQVDGDAPLPTLGQILAVKTETLSLATETGTNTAESTADSTSSNDSAENTGAATTSTPDSSSSTTSSADSAQTSNGSPLDKRITTFGAGLVGVVLGAAVLL
ncbi:glycoside hydrolase family 72 protein [Trichoderma citrinoviride]|uniref:1,3-beta-glucanosyltransferase n=1 Tax=Trichoderma citrinoviride TaxID=58853 RepID=A0A2T4B3G1_9HYPO|nr:glycoside hydrolase family 72 protein [Trichoderma citrinoviride]PTB63866.1 glycoside hydrolase family 72 protein [Trichoderma citrinoviride]